MTGRPLNGRGRPVFLPRWCGPRFLFATLAGYWLAMFVGTHLPPGPDDGGLINDKVLHFTGYAGLGALLATAFPHLSGGLCVLVAATYGAIDELTQPAFGRTADIFDWFADLAGAITGVVIVSAVARYVTSRARN